MTGRTAPMSDAEERAARGAALLDEKQPGWYRDIDLDRLDIRSSCNCVAGQLGGYDAVMCHLGVGHAAETVSLGFDAGTDPDLHLADPDRRADFAALTAAWRSLILARLHGQEQQ